MQNTAKTASPPIMVNISSSQLDIEHPHIPPPPALQDRPFSPARRWGKRSSPAARVVPITTYRGGAFSGRFQPPTFVDDSGRYIAAGPSRRHEARPTTMDDYLQQTGEPAAQGWRILGFTAWFKRTIWLAAVTAR